MFISAYKIYSVFDRLDSILYIHFLIDASMTGMDFQTFFIITSYLKDF